MFLHEANSLVISFILWLSGLTYYNFYTTHSDSFCTSPTQAPRDTILMTVMPTGIVMAL